MSNLYTKIGLEIHIQLKTLSKMFCSCNNQSFAEATDGKQRPVEPNTLVCPVCLALPGSLPVANRQAIEWTIKTGLALSCTINKISKFDRKHYFYPDLPKGYQISQYDEPFAIGGSLEIDGQIVRLNRIHLEEDAGKLIHSGNKSLVDLNRAGTPLMEIVTEPDIKTPAMAADFLRKLQKIVRDVVEVSEASMEKGHMRCDANISVTELQSGGVTERMSPIIEIKNINSFRFVEKALTLVEEKLKSEVSEWPEKATKETWGYDSVANKVYLQRRKEEAADYRYFPEPDLPPIDTTEFDLESLRSSINKTHEVRIDEITGLGITASEAKILTEDGNKGKAFEAIKQYLKHDGIVLLAKALVNNYFGFIPLENAEEFAKLVEALEAGKVQKHQFGEVADKIKSGGSFDEAVKDSANEELDLALIVDEIITNNPKEAERYRSGEQQLLGFFVGQVMKAAGGKANPKEINDILREKL